MLDETDNTTLKSGGNSTAGIPAPRRRRAASRPAGAPAPVETMGAPVAITAAGSGGSIVTSDVEASDLPRPPMGRRRKATSTPHDVKTDVPKVVSLEPTPEEPESADTRTQEKPRRTRRGASETAPSTEAERGTSQRRRATRRRSSRSAEKIEGTTEATTATNKGDGADDDPINVALTEAKARARNHKVEGALANPFGFKEGEERSASDILDSLAAEIGGGEAAIPKRRRRRATRPSEAGSHSAETSGSTDKVAPVEEDKGEIKDRHSSDKKSEKSDYDTTDVVEETVADTEEDGQNRRRRRRRGEDISGSDDDPSDVVIKVREPRSRQSVADEVTGIEGSTRVEAKKQRRREGRAAGRRRSAVITDAEFLARRESVDRKMIVRQSDDYSQLAVLEDGVLVEHYVDRASATSSIGNIYLGKVQNVLPSMEAAFIDIGRGRNAVLYAGEVDWAKYGKEGEDKRIEHVLKSGDQVLVQVTKDPVGAKGARLTSHISVPGRFVVYSPGGHLSGISRKLADSERKRLKKIVENNIPSDASVIVRTAAEGATEEDLVRDINRLKVQWEVIERKVSNSKAPLMLYTEPDLTVRIIRDLFTADFSELVIAGNGGPDDAYDTIKAYVDHVAPEMASRLIHWEHTDKDPFAEYRIDEQVAKALERKVYLPSGGSLVIDRTEAMTVIDVNTGKFTGSAGNLEATVTANNLEAAEEIVRQLRLRDIGGIIVIDFIDMVLPTNRELLVRRLTECLGRDRTRHQVAEVTSLGLVQMTRKKIGTGLAEAFTEQCEACGGRGYRRFDKPVDSQAPADGGERSKGRGRGHKGSSGKSHSK